MKSDVTFYNIKTGEAVTTLETLKSSPIYVTGGNGNFRIPRKYAIKNITGNEEIYNAMLNHIGKKIRFESDQINGQFEIALDGDEIMLREYFE
jgi:hypothetical protein